MVFKNDRDHVSLAGVTRFPAVTINRVKLRGNLQVRVLLGRHNSCSMTSAILW